MSTTTRPSADMPVHLRDRDLESLRFGYSAARYAASILRAVATPQPDPPLPLECRLEELRSAECRMDENSGLLLHIVNAARGGRPYRHDGHEHDSVIAAIGTAIRMVLLANAYGKDVAAAARAWADSHVVRKVERELDVELAITEGYPAEVPTGENTADEGDSEEELTKAQYEVIEVLHQAGNKKLKDYQIAGKLKATPEAIRKRISGMPEGWVNDSKGKGYSLTKQAKEKLRPVT